METLLKPILEAGGLISLAIGFGVLIVFLVKLQSGQIKELTDQFNATIKDHTRVMENHNRISERTNEALDRVSKMTEANTRATESVSDNFTRLIIQSQEKK